MRVGRGIPWWKRRLGGSADRKAPSGHPPIRLSAVAGSAIERWKTSLAEFDFVLGGGIVPGSVVLVGGEPGIGKSTLLMQCAARLESQGVSTLYVSGKESAPAVVLVGHVTKGGGIAGPKTLEHIVDTVLYFEGETTLDHRILRAVKNRFGSVDEIGVFRMTGSGLEPVANPAAAFLAGRSTGASGSAVTALMEGTRPMLVEIQALASKAGFGTPQRVATGLDHRRLALLLAVLERRGGLPFGNLDVFVNVTGGVRLIEPSTDLAVLAALVSTVHDRPVPADALFLGEVGLGGEIRPVAGVERRLAEAARQGFRRVFLSARSRGTAGDLEIIGLEGIGELARRLAA